LALPTPEFVSYIKNIIAATELGEGFDTVLAAVFEAAGKPLKLEQVADPHAGANELVVKVGACGVCGSDIHAARHPDAVFARTLPSGSILGHEFAGEVVEIGPGAERWRVGDRIAGFPIYSCGRCSACRAERVAHCRAARFLGLSDAQGAFAEYVRVPSQHSVPLASHVSFQAGAIAEPLAVCLHAARFATPLRGASVLVIGAGPIGLLLAAVCSYHGARDIIVSDIVGERARRATLVGATGAVDASTEDAREKFRSIARRRPTVVFDAAGSAGSLDLALELAGQDARVVVVAARSSKSDVTTMSGFYKELTVSFAKAYTTGAFREACRLIETGEIDVAPIITDRVGFDAFPAIFDSLSRPSVRGKVLLEPLN
jgi:(R,R)-butanediol dehydrogenase/meso-butanediol dehydrogenase/diacetyl reductase